MEATTEIRKLSFPLPSILLMAFFALLQSPVTRGQFTDPRICQGNMCLCVPSIVDCNRADKIGGIPTNLPPGVTTLNIQHGKFRSPKIQAKNLTNLNQLVSLKVIYCGLEEIDEQAFVGMTNLRSLDLSYNELKVIADYTFYSLSLNKLDIQNNPGLRIYQNSFNEMTTNELNLRSNRMQHLDFTAFEKLRLNKLFLFNNSISQIDERFEDLFDDTTKVFDLTGNPIHCSCQLGWLSRLLTSKQAYKNVHIVCSTPVEFTGKPLNELPISALTCPTPSIKTIFLNVEATWAQLVCVATARISPGISWTYHDGATVKTIRLPPRANGPMESRLAFNVSLVNAPHTYKCSSWVKGGSLEKSVIIKLSGTKLFTNREFKTFSNSENSRTYLSTKQLNWTLIPANATKAPTDFAHEKQFCLLEMIGAVVGTFIFTLGLIALIMWLVTRIRLHKKQQRSRPYYYDIPKMEQPPLPPSPPYYPESIEFYDFKTQQKISVCSLDRL